MRDATERLKEKAQNEATCFALRDRCKDLERQLAESEKAREEKEFDYQQLAEACKQEAITADKHKTRSEAAEAREAVLREALETILEERCFDPFGPFGNIGEICRHALSTLPPRAEKIQGVLVAARNEHKMHQVGCDGGGMLYEKRCDCPFCRAVRELKETEE